MTELLPCPFCGGEAELHPTYDMDTNEVDGWFVWCNNDTCECKPETGQFFTEAEAIEAWNTRAAYEMDGWFYLPKPREAVAEIAETVNSFDGEKWTVQQFFKVQEQAAINWAKELDEHIIKRICEVWNTRAERVGERKTFNKTGDFATHDSRAERTCSVVCFIEHALMDEPNSIELSCGHTFETWDEVPPNYCPNCGARVTETDQNL